MTSRVSDPSSTSWSGPVTWTRWVTHTRRDYYGFMIDRRFARHCTEGKTDRTASRAEPPGRQKERCLTRCDENQMLRPDAAWLRFMMFHLHCQVPAITFKQMCAHKYWKENISPFLASGAKTISPRGIIKYSDSDSDSDFLLLQSSWKQPRPRHFPLSFPRWFYSINLVIMDLISSMVMSEYTLYWSWHASPLTFNLGLISWALSLLCFLPVCALLTFEITLLLMLFIIPPHLWTTPCFPLCSRDERPAVRSRQGPEDPGREQVGRGGQEAGGHGARCQGGSASPWIFLWPQGFFSTSNVSWLLNSHGLVCQQDRTKTTERVYAKLGRRVALGPE